MFYLAGVSVSFFLLILMAGKKGKNTADFILVFWLFFIGTHLLQYYLIITKQIFDYPFLLGISIPFPLVHGPFLFLYISALTQTKRANILIGLLHFIPLIIFFIALIPFAQLPPTTKQKIFINNGEGFEWYVINASIAIIISGVSYIIAALFKLRKYKKSIENEFSNTEQINLNWLRYLIYGIAIIWLFVIIGNDLFIFSTAVIFVSILGYYGIRQMGIFTNTLSEKITTLEAVTDKIQPIQEEEVQNPNKTKYEKSGLSKEQAALIYQNLMKSIETHKLFTETEITLGTLAERLNVHPNHLSQVINSYEAKNFYDFINFHRIAEFKRIVVLPENKNYTLLSLAYECGFNSKTSFNRNFKKVTGLSPSEYLQQANIYLN